MHSFAEPQARLEPPALDALLAAVAAGEQEALARLYAAAATPVYGFALSLLGHPQDAEDILQETFLKVWASAGGYRSQGKPMAWVLTITRNLSLSRIRERGKVHDLSEERWLTLPAESPALTAEDRLVLESALSQLGEDERQIVLLHALSGLRHREIAPLLSLPLSTVLSKYHRAKRKLHTIIREEHFHD